MWPGLLFSGLHPPEAPGIRVLAFFWFGFCMMPNLFYVLYGRREGIL
ncbi:hypothetical protein B4099_1583 [Heyndrickxia coagulans]|uniref:Uncharacterized protein n=1 Tax=Heyndrickxia coagulans TaxID=1398 RepID=A0A150KDU7_HEYCO|nr:hypothetical protein B4099_1583 [Heyndrickxia coagulans]